MPQLSLRSLWRFLLCALQMNLPLQSQEIPIQSAVCMYISYTIMGTYIHTYSAYISLRLSDAYWNMFEQPRVGAVIDFIHRCRLLTVAISIDFTDLVAPGRPSSTPAPGYPLCYAYWVCDNLWALCVTSDAHFHWPTHTKHTPTHTHTPQHSHA